MDLFHETDELVQLHFLVLLTNHLVDLLDVAVLLENRQFYLFYHCFHSVLKQLRVHFHVLVICVHKARYYVRITDI
jgi:hypothetical protein